ncbi:MAG TPA: glutamate--tRNA ligase [Candidatus Paceibacterota bacterium]|nr:glutamate--tRNA ligase [Candidatus Paceibacterota bacterium]
MNNNNTVVTRFPPSPTGFLHIGGVRTALFNYLFAAHHGGTMFLRFEDTDKERSKKEFEDDIYEGLRWLGLPYQTPNIVRQSERAEVYKKYFTQLVEKGLAYEAEESENNPGTHVVRFKNPNKVITFSDLIRGEVTFDTTELGDFVIARSMNEPLYHLAVVIDDFEMGVTHVIRGEDHISNTPRQIVLIEALGFPRPVYAHMPLILAPDKTKLSKRHGAVSVNEYRALGYLPEALINYLALLGWNPGTEQELFTLNELVGAFSFDNVQKSGAVFDIVKLNWINAQHIKRLSNAEYEMRLREFLEEHKEKAPEYLIDIAPELQARAQTLGEAAELLRTGEFAFMEASITVDPLLLLQGAKAETGVVKTNLQKVGELLQQVSDKDFTAEKVKDTIFPYATEVGRAAVLWPMRVALSGKEKSPDPFVLASLIGKQKTLLRIEKAAEML